MQQIPPAGDLTDSLRFDEVLAVTIHECGEGNVIDRHPDTMLRIRVKAEEYLDAGAKEMWLIDGVKRTATVYKADGTVTVLASAGILTSPLLPGFALPLDEYFAGE